LLLSQFSSKDLVVALLQYLSETFDRLSSARRSAERKAKGTGGVAGFMYQAIFFALVVRLVSREKPMLGEALKYIVAYIYMVTSVQ
jgi:hypothetical protein